MHLGATLDLEPGEALPSEIEFGAPLTRAEADLFDRLLAEARESG